MKKTISVYLPISILIAGMILSECAKEKTVSVPILTTTIVSQVTSTSALCGGVITDDKGSTILTRGVCWSIVATPSISDSITKDGAGAGSFTSNITGLYGGTTYYVRAYAANSYGSGYGMTMSFKTDGQPPSKPSAVTQSATSVQPNSAQLNGIVIANFHETTVTFEYGTSISYGNAIACLQGQVNGGNNTNVSAFLTGLTAGGVIYHYRVKAVNSLGTTYGNDFTFTTLGQIPVVSTLSVSNMSSSGAQLNASVNVNFLSTAVTFEYGTSTNYSNTITATTSPVTSGGVVNVSANISGLSLATIYHYRIKAVNSLGTTYGSDSTFSYLWYGADYKGGLVFYIDSTRQHGLVCATNDSLTIAKWGCQGTLVSGANGINLGTGKQNTTDILSSCSTTGIAAKICHDLNLNGYTDWYLPSIGELGLINTNLYRNGFAMYFVSNNYWSSTQFDNIFAMTQSFWGNYQIKVAKSADYVVRSVRSF
jgi:hypothetical protein